MHRKYLTYFTWLDEELITVPDFPAWVCDVCGQRNYDMHAINQLSLLLSPNAGKSSLRMVRPVPAPIEKRKPRQPPRPE